MKTQTSQKWTDVIIEQLNSYAQKEKIEILSSFFKTKKGEYGEGDQFIGITVPNNRLVAKAHKDAPIQTIYELLYHPIHECRLCGGLILVEQFKTNKKARDKQQELVTFYLQHHDRFNNWDLVDLTAPQILGAYLLEENNREVLLELATSNELWKQRIAMVSTFTLIKNHQFQEALQLAQLLIHHPHDLIQIGRASCRERVLRLV